MIENRLLKLFHDVYSTSKAYRNFIDSRNVGVKNIKSLADWGKIPIMDKHNYIKKYSLENRLYNGKKLYNFYMLCSSSGSSGEPTFWPRDYIIDMHLEKKKEEMYEEHFQISKKSTLCVISFGLGVWTAGMLTSKLSWAAAKNNKFTVITPGIDKKNALDVIRRLYKFYDQVILLGYPPFITDLVEYSKENGFDMRKANIKVMYTSEGFSENWRNLIVKSISKNNSRYDVVGFYASADTGIIGAENRFIIDLLDKASKNKDLSLRLFGSTNTPSLVTYDPSVKFLECIDGEILITSDQPVPLIRYNIHDRGGLIKGAQIKVFYKKFGYRFNDNEINDYYVFVFGRSDAVKLTANIYIEDIKYCLENSKFKGRLSGNFKYGTDKNSNLRKRLKVIIFLKKNGKLNDSEKEYFEKEFYKNLLEANNDFKMIQSGTKIEKFRFEFISDTEDKYKTSKLKYFL